MVTLAELLPASGAVDAGGFIELRVDALHGGQVEHDEEAPEVPVIDKGDGVEGGSRPCQRSGRQGKGMPRSASQGPTPKTGLRISFQI